MANNMQDWQKMGQQFNVEGTMKQFNVEGTMKAVSDWQKNMQTIASELTSYSKRSFEDSTQTFEKLLSVKSLDQVFEIQSSYVKRAYDDYVQQMTKIGGIYSDFAKEAVKPVTTALQPQSR